MSIVNNKLKISFTPKHELAVENFTDGLNIWSHKDVLSFWQRVALRWRPQNDTAVFIPCSAHKPYPYSKSHRDGYLKALLPYLDKIDLFAISEPMGVVPYHYADEYPVQSYEYDPNKFFIGKLHHPLVQASLDIFCSRLSIWIRKFDLLYRKKILILPKSWHLKVFKKSLEMSKIALDSYSIITLPGRPQHHVNEIGKSFASLVKPR